MIKHALSVFGLYIFLLQCFQSLVVHAKETEQDIWIVGWNQPGIAGTSKQPPAWLGNDPVLGRLLCPPISRLLLDEQRSDGLIFSEVKTIANSNSTFPIIWHYDLRPGIFWWSGKEVTSQDLKSFFEENLSKVVELLSGGSWKTPKFEMQIHQNGVQIKWRSAPAFGPYIWNGYPFYSKQATPSKASLFEWQCAGIYRPTKITQSSIYTEPNPGYHSIQNNIVFHTEMKNTTVSRRVIQFNMPDEFSVDPAQRSPTKPQKCSNPILTPYISAILWNPQNEFLSQAEIRKTLTSLLPRKTILEAASGFAGNILATFVPSIHPGHPDNLKPSSLKLTQASSKLTKLGYARPKGDSERIDQKGNPIELHLATQLERPGIVEKVIADTLLSVGIKTHFVSLKDKKADIKKLDGALVGMRLPWPEMNLLPSFHPDSPQKLPYQYVYPKSFLEHLSNHSLASTTEQPSFKQLHLITQELTKFEPASVLLQHRACLSDSKYRKHRPIREQDPDWFRKILLR